MARLTLGALFVAVALVGSSPAWADGPILVPFTHVSSDAAPDMFCDLSLGVNASNEILGVDYVCKGSKIYHDFYTLDQLRRGVVLYHYDPMNVDVISMVAPDADPVHGGQVTIRYLSNALKMEFKEWQATVEPQGLKWVAYTSVREGHRAFNDIFAVKKTVMGQLVGIQEIRASWK